MMLICSACYIYILIELFYKILISKSGVPLIASFVNVNRFKYATHIVTVYLYFLDFMYVYYF